MHYKVAVITPCYNIYNFKSNESHLFEKNIKSVQNQTIGYENIEHILIDNGSVDETRDTLEKISEENKNVKIFTIDENTGSPGIPRNIGIENTSADYVFFLDDDDQLTDNALEVMYERIEKEQLDIVGSHHLLFDGEKVLKPSVKFKMDKYYDINNSDFMECTKATLMINRDFLMKKRIRFPNSLAEDSKFNMECLLNTDKPILILSDHYSKIYFSDNSTSLSHEFDRRQIKEYAEVHTWCINECMSKGVNNDFLCEYYKSNVLLLIGNLLRSNETISNKKMMIGYIRKFLLEFKEIPLNLPFQWKIFYFLIKYNMKYSIIFSSEIIKIIFEQKLFKNIFRNQNYK